MEKPKKSKKPKTGKDREHKVGEWRELNQLKAAVTMAEVEARQKDMASDRVTGDSGFRKGLAYVPCAVRTRRTIENKCHKCHLSLLDSIEILVFR